MFFKKYNQKLLTKKWRYWYNSVKNNENIFWNANFERKNVLPTFVIKLIVSKLNVSNKWHDKSKDKNYTHRFR